MSAVEWPENRMKISDAEVEAYAKEKGIEISFSDDSTNNADGTSGAPI